MHEEVLKLGTLKFKFICLIGILYYLSYNHVNITNIIICIVRSSYVNKNRKYLYFDLKCRISILIIYNIMILGARYLLHNIINYDLTVLITWNSLLYVGTLLYDCLVVYALYKESILINILSPAYYYFP